VVLALTIAEGRIAAIDLSSADPDRLHQIALTILD